MSNRRRYGRRWEEKVFENTGFQEVANWISGLNGQGEIVYVTGNMVFDYKGIFFRKPEWYFQYIRIKYYPNEEGHSYHMTWDDEGDHLFHSGIRDIERWKNSNIPNNRQVLFDRTRSAYVTGGSRSHCCCVLYECA